MTTDHRQCATHNDGGIGVEVVSALGLPGWPIGEEVKAQRIIDAARPLQDR